MTTDTMPTVSSWKDNYSVHIPEIDDHHQKLVGLMDSLKAAVANGRGKEAYPQILDELVQYTHMHFAFEESLMRKYKYPELQAHHAAHVVFATDILGYQRLYQSGGTVLSVVLLRKLMAWLTDHITTMDQACAAHLRHGSR